MSTLALQRVQLQYKGAYRIHNRSRPWNLNLITYVENDIVLYFSSVLLISSFFLKQESLFGTEKTDENKQFSNTKKMDFFFLIVQKKLLRVLS